MVPRFRGTGTTLVLHALLAAPAFAASTNITIDDTNGTFWTFVGGWHAVTPTTPCPPTTCFAQPDPSLAINKTWHDGNTLSGSCSFQGSAIYIYGIDLAATSGTNISFDMNHPSQTGFHYFEGSETVYNSLFFSATDLDSSVEHTVTWIGQPSSAGGGAMLFDYAVITVDEEDNTSSSAGSGTPASSLTSSSADVSTPASSSNSSPTPSSSGTGSPAPMHKSKTGPIVGAVVGVGAGFAILLAVFLLLRRRGASGPSNIDIESYYELPPLEPYQPGHTNEASLLGPAVSSPGLLPVSAPPLSSPSSAISTASPHPTSESKSPPVILTWDPSDAARSRDSEVEKRLRQLEALARPPEYTIRNS
ncbi:hypothetical protein C8R44DRAFT_814951 [Mycena epipterygia]|nr:hypothetical protein C8R44DRAFT_814951 [Mycena epipterygia]